MNPWSPLGEAVHAPLPYPWRPAQPPPVDQATLRRVIAGLEQLAAQHRGAQRAAPAEARVLAPDWPRRPQTRPAPAPTTTPGRDATTPTTSGARHERKAQTYSA